VAQAAAIASAERAVLSAAKAWREAEKARLSMRADPLGAAGELLHSANAKLSDAQLDLRRATDALVKLEEGK
jgi:hypothetical protein